MRLVFQYATILLMLVLAACAGSSNGGSSSTTTVTIGVGAITGAAGAVTIPVGVQSFRVDALQNGAVIATASATLPTTSVQLTLVNGVYRFRLIALDAAGAGLYQGVSTAQTLIGSNVSVPISMTGFVSVTPNQTTANVGDTIHFTAQFATALPTSANPLVWSATGGVVTVDTTATFGSSATWTAPTKAGVYVVTAKVDTTINAKQTNNGSGDVTISVGDVTAPTIIPASSHLSLPDPGVALRTLLLGPKLQAWVNGSTALDDADGFVSVTHSALPSFSAVGDTTVDFYATDAAGNKSTLSTTVTLYTPSTTTFTVQDLLGNSIPNVTVSGIALGSLSAVQMVNSAGSAITDNAGSLVASALNAAETYLVIATSPQDNYADGFWSGQIGGNVVSIYNGADALINPVNLAKTLKMAVGGHISGQVLDAAGAPVPHARVDYSFAPYDDLGAHFTAFATTAGTFTIGMEPGSYQLYATGTAINPDTGVEQALTSRLSGGFYAGNGAVVSPYASQASTVVVVQGGTKTANMKLVSAGGMVVGRVHSPTGQPVKAMRVNIEPYGGVGNPVTYEVVTDVSGLYQLNVPSGSYRLVATNKVFDPVSRIDTSLSAGLVGGFSTTTQGSIVRDSNAAQIYNVSAGGQRIVDFTLKQGGAITGTVTGARYVRIFAQDLSTADTQQTFTDGLGKYTLNMMPGTVRLVVDSYSMDPISGQLVPLAGGVAGGYVNASGVAQSVAASAAAIAVSANGVVTQNIQLNVGTIFDAAAVVGTFIP
ncbi:MAG: carboxypeptidase-like regulatory domain-containing protein [Mariprofundales bacterium]